MFSTPSNTSNARMGSPPTAVSQLSFLESGAKLFTPLHQQDIAAGLKDRYVRIVDRSTALNYVPEADLDGPRRKVIYFPDFSPDAPERALVRGVRWEIDNTSLSFLDRSFGIFAEIRRLAETRDLSGDPLRILDWGFGQGQALSELAAHLRSEGHSGSRTMGYADQFYPEWHSLDRDTEVIWDASGYLGQYIPDRSLDLVYSFAGLSNFLHYKGITAVNHLQALLGKIRPGGGLIILDRGLHRSFVDEQLPRLGFKIVGVPSGERSNETNYVYRAPGAAS